MQLHLEIGILNLNLIIMCIHKMIGENHNFITPQNFFHKIEEKCF